MAIPKIEVTAVNIGAAADDGTGDKLRKALELLNSNDASLARVLAAILKDADPELSSFAQIAQVIYDFNAVVQALPLPAAIQAQVTAAINAALAQLPSPASYTAQITTAIAAAVAALDANNLVKKNGDQLTGALDFAATVQVASAATTDLSNTASNNVEVTGTATVTSFGLRAAGAIRFVRFRDAGLVLTHHAANLILPGAANITTLAGDCAILRSHGSGAWRVLLYSRADGAALVALAKASMAQAQAGTDDAAYMTPAGTLAAILANASPEVAQIVRNVRELQLNAWADRQNIVNGIVDPLSDASDLNAAVSANYTLTGGVIAPQATGSNVATTGFAIANSQASGSPGSNAFDGTTSTSYVSGIGGTSNIGVAYVGQDFGAGNAKDIAQMVLTNQNVDGNCISSVKIQYSDDMATWSTVSTNAVSASASGTTTLTIPAGTGAHRGWRLLANSGTNGGSSNGWAVAELTMLQRAAATMLVQSVAFPLSLSSPGVGRMAVQFPASAPAFTVNTDFTASISRDGGTTFTAVPLALAMTQADGATIYDGSVSIAGQPAGASLVWKISSPTTKGIPFTGVVAEMRAS